MTADPPHPASTARRSRAAALALLCAAISIPSYLIGLRLPPSEGPDIVADWLVTRAAVDGADPYANPDDLAARYGVEYRFRTTPELDSAAVSHPRTPGALVVMTPLLLLPPERLSALAVAATLVCIVLVVLIGLDMAGAPSWLAVPIVLLALPTPPTILAVHHATQSGIIALLVTYGIWSTRRSDSVPGGLALGVATVLKVFPGVLILPLVLRGRIRASAAWLAVLCGLTLAGLAFSGVEWRRALEALGSASGNWMGLSANGSSARVLTLAGVPTATATVVNALVVGAATAVIAFFSASRAEDLARVLAGLLALGLLWIPLSWIHYDLALFPVAVLAGARLWQLQAHVAARVTCIGLVVLSFAPLGIDPGVFGAARRSFLAVVLLTAGGIVVRDEARDERLFVKPCRCTLAYRPGTFLEIRSLSADRSGVADPTGRNREWSTIRSK